MSFDPVSYMLGKAAGGGGGGESTIVSKTITANGTYNASSDNADGYSPVMVAVPSPNINFACNWQFDAAHIMNSRGNSSYSSASEIQTIDAWRAQGCILTLVEDGIKLEQYSAGTNGYFMLNFNESFVKSCVGKQMIFTGWVDDKIGSTVITSTSSTGQIGQTATVSGVNFRVYKYSTTRFALTIDAISTAAGHIIKAVKFEVGDTQTLAHQENGVWVLNQTQKENEELIKIDTLMYYSK